MTTKPSALIHLALILSVVALTFNPQAISHDGHEVHDAHSNVNKPMSLWTGTKSGELMSESSLTAQGKARDSIEQGSMKNGDSAPDFTLSDCEGKNPVTLSKLQGKPTVLVFGSCSCPPFVSSTKATEALYKKYHERVNFIMVYVREAHPTDGWKIADNQFQVKSPTSTEERCALAKDFDQRITVSMPIVVDTIDDPVAKLYSPWPNRMVIIDAQGKVVDKGEAGPQGTAKSAKRASAILDGLLPVTDTK